MAVYSGILFQLMQRTVFSVEYIKNRIVVLFEGFKKNIFEDIIAGGIHTGDEVFQNRDKGKPHNRTIQIDRCIVAVDPVAHFMADIINGLFISVNIVIQLMDILITIHAEFCRKLLIADKAGILNNLIVLFFGNPLDNPV